MGRKRGGLTQEESDAIHHRKKAKAALEKVLTDQSEASNNANSLNELIRTIDSKVKKGGKRGTQAVHDRGLRRYTDFCKEANINPNVVDSNTPRVIASCIFYNCVDESGKQLGVTCLKINFRNLPLMRSGRLWGIFTNK